MLDGKLESRVDEVDTERLVIRQLTHSDDEFIVRLLNEKSFLHFIGDKRVRNRADARNYLTNGPMASYAKHGYGLFLVSEKFSGTPVGMCGLLRRDNQEHPDIGFAFLAAYQARGYGLESAAAVMDFGHMQLNIETIVAFVSPDNERSIRLLERLGFAFAGEGSLEGIDKPQSLYSSARAT
jgi:RimJ/RimL family protein N-acetyltransferase